MPAAISTLFLGVNRDARVAYSSPAPAAGAVSLPPQAGHSTVTGPGPSGESGMSWPHARQLQWRGGAGASSAGASPTSSAGPRVTSAVESSVGALVGSAAEDSAGLPGRSEGVPARSSSDGSAGSRSRGPVFRSASSGISRAFPQEGHLPILPAFSSRARNCLPQLQATSSDTPASRSAAPLLRPRRWCRKGGLHVGMLSGPHPRRKSPAAGRCRSAGAGLPIPASIPRPSSLFPPPSPLFHATSIQAAAEAGASGANSCTSGPFATAGFRPRRRGLVCRQRPPRSEPAGTRCVDAVLSRHAEVSCTAQSAARGGDLALRWDKRRAVRTLGGKCGPGIRAKARMREKLAGRPWQRC
jgi:hypothetical protein